LAPATSTAPCAAVTQRTRSAIRTPGSDLPVTFDPRQAVAVVVPPALRAPTRFVLSALIDHVRVPDPIMAMTWEGECVGTRSCTGPTRDPPPWTVDLADGKIRETRLDDHPQEFPRINSESPLLRVPAARQATYELPKEKCRSAAAELSVTVSGRVND
jgi:hypothetical protein